MLNITVIGVGRMGKGPEADLARTYLGRINKLPQKWSATIAEIDDRQAPNSAGRKAWDAEKIISLLPEKCWLAALDERGTSMKSPVFSQKLQGLELDGRSVCFAIGGPDGLDEQIRSRADALISFGAMTWPHKMVRAMLLEQIYRAGAIASGHPYHRV